MAVKGILIGLGNPIRSDDCIGPVVCQEVHKRVPDFDVDISCAGGFDVVDRILGHKTAVIIDSMVTGEYPPGTAVRLDPESALETLRAGQSHGLNFLEAIGIARSCDAPVPANLILYGIEVEDPFSLGERISPSVVRNLDRIVGQIADEIFRVR